MESKDITDTLDSLVGKYTKVRWDIYGTAYVLLVAFCLSLFALWYRNLNKQKTGFEDQNSRSKKNTDQPDNPETEITNESYSNQQTLSEISVVLRDEIQMSSWLY